MRSQAKLERFGVALLATRLSVLGDDPCGGSEVVLWEDANILKNAGIPVRVYGCAARGGAPVHLVPLRTSAPLVTSLEYGGQLLRKERDAFIIAYNEPSLAGWAPERTIARFDWSTALPRYWKWPFWRSRFERARYLFPSESERQEFLQQHETIPVESVSVVPNAVDLRLFQPQNGNGGTAKKPAGPLRVGFAGQWVERKGVEDLLNAWLVVKSKISSAELVLAGGPGLWKATSEPAGTDTCVTHVAEMQQAGLLRSVGAVPRGRMPEFWNSLDVAVVPSRYEPFGLVALEAMACGVPVVATAVGGLKEIVQNGESGILVPPGNPAALAEAVSSLLIDEGLRLRLGQGARRRSADFSVERRTRELLKLLSETIEKAA
jgi:glycosyltransferase involved in cell wall biosynthesis